MLKAVCGNKWYCSKTLNLNIKQIQYIKLS